LENEFYEEIIVRTKVKRKLVDKFEPQVRTFADWMKAHLEATGKIPELSVSQVRDRRDESENVFRREGKSWRIRYDGLAMSLPDTKGMHFLSIMLSNPGRAFPVLKLYHGVDGIPYIEKNDTFSQMSEERWAEEGMSISTPKELEDKPRKAVSIAIKRSLEIINQEHPALGQHLKNSLKTGFSCSYTPDKPITWEL